MKWMIESMYANVAEEEEQEQEKIQKYQNSKDNNIIINIIIIISDRLNTEDQSKFTQFEFLKIS